MKYDKLIEAASEVRANAYTPYSHFKVGAALLGDNGEIYRGCNVENSSYGLSICAERTAVFKGVCAGVTQFEALAVVTDLDNPASPCGACRQVLAEFSPEMIVIMANTKGKAVTSSVKELLPLAFSSSQLVIAGKQS